MKFGAYRATLTCAFCGADKPEAPDLCSKSDTGRHHFKTVIWPIEVERKRRRGMYNLMFWSVVVIGVAVIGLGIWLPR